jgi:hypothetical protein
MDVSGIRVEFVFAFGEVIGSKPVPTGLEHTNGLGELVKMSIPEPS